MVNIEWKDVIGENIEVRIEKYVSDMPVVIYGAGIISDMIFKTIGEKVKPIAICDGNKEKIGCQYKGYTVQSFDEVLEKEKEFKILIASYEYYEAIKKDILVKVSEKYILPKLEKGFLESVYVYNNKEKIQSIYDKLSDDRSKQIYLAYLKSRCTNNPEFVYKYVSNDSYFVDGVIQLSSNEVFVDGGACWGDTVDDFIRLTDNKFQRIYAFEPFKEAYEKLAEEKREKHGDDERIILMPYGLYDEKKKVGFNSNAAMGNTTVEELFDADNGIDVIDLDSVINEDVTFLKMDIEGSELAALNGAQEVIKKSEPKLAICVYHKFDDIVTIPEFIMNLGVEYKYYLRHHAVPEFPMADLVFYASK